jgi:hypothetical protein
MFFFAFVFCSQQWDGTVLLMSITCQPCSMSVTNHFNRYLAFFLCWSFFFYFHIIVQIVDPGGISNWSVTHVDWSEGKWHPRSYRAADITYALLKNLTVCFYLGK